MLSSNKAFEVYKKEEGKELQDSYYASKESLVSSKAELKALSSSVNTVKREIDSLNSKLALKRAQVSPSQVDGVDVIDEEEYSTIRDLKAKKKEYKGRAITHEIETPLNGFVHFFTPSCQDILSEGKLLCLKCNTQEVW